MTSTSPPRRVVAAVLATALAAAGVGACGDDEPDLPTPIEQLSDLPAAPTPTSSVDLDPEEGAAVDEVLALYDGYLTTYVALATSEEPPTGHREREFLDYAEAEFTTEARNEIVQNYLDGRLFTGTLSWSLLELVEIDLERTVDGDELPQVVFRVCVDGSTWTVVERDTGDQVEDPPGSYTATVTAEWREEREFGPEGWGLREQENDRSAPC